MQTVLKNAILAGRLVLFGFSANAQSRYDYGRGREPLDRHELDDVIGSLQSAVRSNRIGYPIVTC